MLIVSGKQSLSIVTPNQKKAGNKALFQLKLAAELDRLMRRREAENKAAIYPLIQRKESLQRDGVKALSLPRQHPQIRFSKADVQRRIASLDVEIRQLQAAFQQFATKTLAANFAWRNSEPFGSQAGSLTRLGERGLSIVWQEVYIPLVYDPNLYLALRLCTSVKELTQLLQRPVQAGNLFGLGLEHPQLLVYVYHHHGKMRVNIAPSYEGYALYPWKTPADRLGLAQTIARYQISTDWDNLLLRANLKPSDYD